MTGRGTAPRAERALKMRLCKVFGHRWVAWSNGAWKHRRCERCHAETHTAR